MTRILIALLLTLPLAITACGKDDEEGAHSGEADVEHAEGKKHEESDPDEGHEEGGIELTPEQIKAAGIVLAQAGPAKVREVLPLYGVVSPNAERVRDVAARFPGVIHSVQKKIGDVHLAWENEAQLEVHEAKGDLDIVYPPISIRAEPHVAIVDGNVDRKKSRAAAEAYLKFVYTDEGQEIVAKHHYRPSNEAVLKKHAADFPEIKLFAVTEIGAAESGVRPVAERLLPERCEGRAAIDHNARAYRVGKDRRGLREGYRRIDRWNIHL